uniref:Uncharacterized protein n=1 Tax=Setaria digitata TaxID=48799 RepID=A0A915PSY4_9BILA
MKTAVFGHDEICDDTTLSLNSGAIPPLTFAPPASLSVSSSLQIRCGTGGVSNAVSGYRSHHSRRTSRMQNGKLYEIFEFTLIDKSIGNDQSLVSCTKRYRIASSECAEKSIIREIEKES